MARRTFSMRWSRPRFQPGLQLRLLGWQLAGVTVALATMFALAHWSIADDVRQYATRQQAAMNALLAQLGAPPGQPVGLSIDDAATRPAPGTVGSNGALDVALPPPPQQADLPSGLLDLPPIGNSSPLETEQILTDAVNRSLIAAGLAGGVMALLLAMVVSRRIVRPLRSLTTAARRLQMGDFEQHIARQSADEVGELAEAFNTMVDALAETERLRRVMVSDVAHELRRPLTNLCGYLEALRDGVIDAQTSTIESLYVEAMALAQIVDDLRDLALGDAGQLELRRSPLRVVDLLEQASLAARPAALKQGVTLTVLAMEDTLIVDGDDRRLGQVLRNILANALAHTATGGSIVLSATVAGMRRAAIQIQDTGCGVPAEHLPYVFERFYRADPSRDRTTGNSGLGLAIVKQLVEAHGGGVRISSQLSRGTTVTVTLPLACETDPVLDKPGGKLDS